ncbi:MAG: hypothetical protein DIU69_08840 [Bacillota bacterium]|nr:MAG: hypothetical protein DIU69_08840 [Bacillota bacterium]
MPRDLTPWTLRVVRDGREEVHEAPAVAGVLPKLAEAVGRAAEEGGAPLEVSLIAPDGRTIFRGRGGRHV